MKPHRLTPAVVNLARTIYDDRTFDRLPTLADALEDAGCTNAEVLGHLGQTARTSAAAWSWT